MSAPRPSAGEVCSAVETIYVPHSHCQVQFCVPLCQHIIEVEVRISVFPGRSRLSPYPRARTAGVRAMAGVRVNRDLE